MAYRILSSNKSIFVLSTDINSSIGWPYSFSKSGEKNWSRKFKTIGVFRIIQGRLYVGGRTVKALNPETGDSIFQTRLPKGNCYSLLEYSGIIYFSTANGMMYGLHADTGDMLWKTNVATEYSFNIYKNNILSSSRTGLKSYSSENSWLESIRESAPDVVNTWDITYGGYVTYPAIQNKVLFRGSIVRDIQKEAPVIAYSLNRSEIIWSRDLHTHSLTPVITNTNSFTISRAVGADTTKSTLYSLAISTGKTKWNKRLPYRGVNLIATNNSILISGTKNENDEGMIEARKQSSGKNHGKQK